MNITIDKVEYHRNGISGAGFHVMLFNAKAETPNGIKIGESGMIGIVFSTSGHVAVMSRDDVASGRVDCAWRGDVFENDLRYAILKDQITEAAAHLLSYDVADIADYIGVEDSQVGMVLGRLRAEKE